MGDRLRDITDHRPAAAINNEIRYGHILIKTVFSVRIHCPEQPVHGSVHNTVETVERVLGEIHELLSHVYSGIVFLCVGCDGGPGVCYEEVVEE